MPLTEKSLEPLAAHVGECSMCAVICVLYQRELLEAGRSRELPAPVASKIRARLCRTGAVALDVVVGAVAA